MKSIDIVMATYKPNEVYFIKLLKSLNEQTYPYIRLIVRDDSSSKLEYEKIKKLIYENISNFKYEIYRNSRNVGSNKTFEKLTLDASAEYIAYCDQDDIWECDKLTKLVEVIEKESAVLCYSDLSIINENDDVIAKSFRQINKRLKHIHGDNLFRFFISRNSITGCTMLIKTDIAKLTVPFNNNYIHDHWLALYSTTFGKISYISEKLVKYRIHQNNQIGTNFLLGINNRNDYLNKIKKQCEIIKDLKKIERFNNLYYNVISESELFFERRISLYENRSIIDFFKVITYIFSDLQLVILDIILNILSYKYSNTFLILLKGLNTIKKAPR